MTAADDVSPYLRLPIRDRKTIALAIAKNALRRIAASNRGDVSTLAQDTLRRIEAITGGDGA